jgi:aspartyl-tRNA(Asn)/glutamyl-tRNA(Gln) amidotransferase subunit A
LQGSSGYKGYRAISSQSPNSIPFWPIAKLIAGYRRKELSPIDVVGAILDRIERHNPFVNAFCHLDAEGALRLARESEVRWVAGAPRGAVDGIPVGVKDNILVAGMPARFGSTLPTATSATDDAPAVARLREQGAIVLGKTAMPEFGWKAVSDSPLTGITRNPWNTRKTTGGSSSGAVAATVLGMGSIHLGTDGGGSIRIPAAFTGCYGIKPTRARVPAWPTSPLGTLAHHGPMARSVADTALALSIIAAPDARDVYAWTSPAPDFHIGLDDGVRGLRIAYSPRLGFVKRVDAEVETAVKAAARAFESFGAHVEAADPEIGGDPIETWSTLWWSSAASILKPHGEQARAKVDPGLIAGAALGDKIPAVDFINAQVKRAEIANTFTRFFERYDLLLTPSVPLAAFEAGCLVPPTGNWGRQWMDWAPFSYPFNLTQQPAASIPCGMTRDGLPIGLQIVGAVGADALVLRASQAFEMAQPFPALEDPRVC